MFKKLLPLFVLVLGVSAPSEGLTVVQTPSQQLMNEFQQVVGLDEGGDDALTQMVLRAVVLQDTDEELQRDIDTHAKNAQTKAEQWSLIQHMLDEGTKKNHDMVWALDQEAVHSMTRMRIEEYVAAVLEDKVTVELQAKAADEHFDLTSLQLSIQSLRDNKGSILQDMSLRFGFSVANNKPLSPRTSQMHRDLSARDERIKAQTARADLADKSTAAFKSMTSNVTPLALGWKNGEGAASSATNLNAWVLAQMPALKAAVKQDPDRLLLALTERMANSPYAGRSQQELMSAIEFARSK